MHIVTYCCYVKVAPEEVFDTEGFFATGDAGFVDEEGHLHWVGRTSDLIKTGGANVSPVEIDNELLRHPGLSSALAVGVPHPTLGEIVVVCAVAQPGSGIDENGVRVLPAWAAGLLQAAPQGPVLRRGRALRSPATPRSAPTSCASWRCSGLPRARTRSSLETSSPSTRGRRRTWGESPSDGTARDRAGTAHPGAEPSAAWCRGVGRSPGAEPSCKHDWPRPLIESSGSTGSSSEAQGRVPAAGSSTTHRVEYDAQGSSTTSRKPGVYTSNSSGCLCAAAGAGGRSCVTIRS